MLINWYSKILHLNKHAFILCKCDKEQKNEHNFDFLIEDCNDSFANLFNKKPFELVDKKYTEISDLLETIGLKKSLLLSNLIDCNSSKMEVVTKINNKFFNIQFLTLDDEHFAMFLNHEQTKSEESLRFQERDNLLVKTINSVSDAIIYTDLKGNVIGINTAAQKLTGYTLDEAKGFQVEVIFEIAEISNLKELENPIKKSLRTRENNIFENVALLAPKIESEFIISGSTSLVYSGTGDLIGILMIFNNISEQFYLHKILTESEKKFRIIFEQSPLGIYLFDRKGLIKELNDKFVEIIGSTREQLLGLNTLDLPNKKLTAEIQKCLEGGEGFYYDWYHPITSKKPSFDKVMFKGLRDEKGQIFGGIALVEDVTDKIVKEQEIERLASIFVNSINEIYILDAQTLKFVNANVAALKNIGYTLDELKNISIENVLFNYDFKNFENILINLQKNEVQKSRKFFTIIRKNQTHYTTEAHIQLIESEKPFYVAYCIDITEKDAMRNKLKESELLLSTLIENIPHSITYKDAKGRWLLANKATINLLGLNNVDFLLKTDSELAELTSNVTKNALLNCQKSDELAWDAEKVITVEEMINISDQNYVVYEVTKVPFYNNDGTRKAMMVIAKDVTERHKMIDEIVNAKLVAENANRVKTLFFANISHELKNPLSGILGITELINNFDLPSSLKPYIENVNNSAITLSQIIGDILDLSKIEAGKIEINFTEVDLYETIREIIKSHSILATKKNLDLILDMDYSVPRFLEIDQLRFKQVISNILNNAIKFTENGEVELSVKFEKIDEKTGRFIFSVRDTGIGISEEKQKYIFDPFAQAELNTYNKFGGTGLGLAISKNITEKMSGKIWLTSVPSKGSTFYISFDTKYKTEKYSKVTNFKNALIIEKNMRSAEILNNLLSKLSIISIKTFSIIEAVDYVRNNTFDLIFVDSRLINEINSENFEKFILNKKTKIILTINDMNKFAKNNFSFKYTNKMIRPFDQIELYKILTEVSTIESNKEESGIKIKEEKIIQPSILIVEDNALNLTLAKMLITKVIPHARVIDAANGEDAIKIFQSNKVDLIFMDIQMPTINGLEATKLIRDLEKNSNNHVPVIALTAAVLPEDKNKCLSAGMDDFIAKPIDVELLRELLNKYVA